MRVVKILTLIATLSFFAPESHAQMMCDKHEKMVRILREQHREVRLGFGLAGQRAIELYASEGGSFTILIIHPNGLSCLMAAGEGWEVLKITEPVGPQSVS